jgi:hypothetical protein
MLDRRHIGKAHFVDGLEQSRVQLSSHGRVRLRAIADPGTVHFDLTNFWLKIPESRSVVCVTRLLTAAEIFMATAGWSAWCLTASGNMETTTAFNYTNAFSIKKELPMSNFCHF